MRRLLPFALLAAGCFTDPTPPADAGQDASQGEDWHDVVEASVDTGQLLDAGQDVGPSDTGPLPDLDPLDLGPEAGVVDAGQRQDIPSDNIIVDPPRDAGPDVRDSGPVDAGPTVYDLEGPRTALEVHLVARRSNSGGALDCADATMSSCSIRNGQLSFSVTACGGGLFSGLARETGAPSLSTTTYFAQMVQVRLGALIDRRRSAHFQWAATSTGDDSYRGIAGRTVDPALADLWVLGCPVAD